MKYETRLRKTLVKSCKLMPTVFKKDKSASGNSSSGSTFMLGRAGDSSRACGCCFVGSPLLCRWTAWHWCYTPPLTLQRKQCLNLYKNRSKDKHITTFVSHRPTGHLGDPYITYNGMSTSTTSYISWCGPTCCSKMSTETGSCTLVIFYFVFLFFCRIKKNILISLKIKFLIHETFVYFFSLVPVLSGNL